jgi:putative transposase
LDHHLIGGDGAPTRRNRRNGRTTKRVKTDRGSIEIATPRDRDGSFEPQLVKKRQTTLGPFLEEKILGLYAMGLSYADIRDHLAEMYGFELSGGKLSEITDAIIPELEAWRSRELAETYAFVWLDAIHIKVRDEGRIVTKAFYTVLGVDMKGKKELLGLYLSENEGANFWMQVLADLQYRGLKDILIASIDNLKGFAQAIESVFPSTEVQLCIVHQVRNSLRYVASKDQRAFLTDLKKVYRAPQKQTAENQLAELEKAWGKKYPMVIKSWSDNWERLTQYFKYPPEIRKVIYTTNTVESFHRQIRKAIKTKGAFPSEMAALKMLFLATQRITKKWTIKLSGWGQTVQQLAVLFEGRVALKLN